MTNKFPSDYEIYEWLLEDDFIINKKIHSPIHRDRPQVDKNPSFSIYETSDGELRWKDFGLMKQSGNKAVNLLMHMEGIDFKTAMNKIRTEFGKNYDRKVVDYKERLYIEKDSKPPEILYGYNYKPFELGYWEDYYQTEEDLKRERIFALRLLQWSEGGFKEFSTDYDPAFVFEFDIDSWKRYRPLTKNKQYKWSSFNIEGVMEGWHSWSKNSEYLIISSSTKDRVCVKKAGFDSINPVNEGSFTSFINTINIIKAKARHPIIMLDADNAGFEASVKLSKYFGLPMVDMRGQLSGEKDFADFMKKYGPYVLEKRINYLTSKLRNYGN